MSDDRFIEYGTSVGSLKEPGLPNITGRAGLDSLYGLVYQNSKLEGAFGLGEKYGGIPNGISGTGYALNFDASLSNSIYGNSTTVQPKSLVLTGIIKY